MALRLHGISDDEWHKLAAARRADDLGALPARASIAAIEVELRALAQRFGPGATAQVISGAA